MGFYTSTRLLTEAGEGDIKIPLDPEDDGFHSIDPLEDHEGDAAGEIDPDPIVSVGESYMIMAECESNWNTIMKEAGIRELLEYTNTGRDFIYESVDIKGFFTKAKNMFLELIKRIAAVLKTWLAKVESMVRSGKAFTAKYGSAIVEGAKKLPKDFKFEGYKYQHLGVKGASGGTEWDVDTAYGRMTGVRSVYTVEAVNKNLDDEARFANAEPVTGDEYQSTLNQVRGAAIGAASIESSEFAKQLFEYFHGSSKKVTLKASDVDGSTIISQLNGTADLRKGAKTAYRKIEKEVNGIIRELNTIEGKLKRDKDLKSDVQQHKVTMVSMAVRTNKDLVNILHGAYSAYLSGLGSYNRQCRALAARCIAATNKYVKPGTKTESTFMGIDLL